MCGVFLWSRQHPRPIGGDGHRVLEMGRIFSVFRHRGPLVRLYAAARPPGIHHWLDRQHHTFLQSWILASPVHIIRNLGLLMHMSADAMPHELADDRKSVGG